MTETAVVSPCNDAACFALLDDCNAERDPRSRLYTDLVSVLSCDEAGALSDVLAQMECALGQGLHAVGVFTYELGASLQGVDARNNTGLPSRILLFRQCTLLSNSAVSQWLDEYDERIAPAGIAGLHSSVDEHRFAADIAAIHAYIEAGDTYQINYTYRLRFDAFGAPISLYRRLRQRQPVPYGALIAMPSGETILSLSPELFVRHDKGTLTARPMKGTAAASGEDAVDAERSTALARDPKNRAENLMIVDLLRNDLGRIAELGSVHVPKLFSVDRYSSVLQMTSTVQATLRGDVKLAEIFNALYPCGSITGAPKRRTMQIIRELEDDARGYYTGAIGWFDAPPSGQRVGDFCLSVPIRTLVLGPETAAGVRNGEMGVGAGIVHDSRAEEEFAECHLKAGFLTGLSNDFELFETMRATHEEGCHHLALHLQRLRKSANYFGFVFDEDEIWSAVLQACATLASGNVYRMRLALSRNGRCSVQTGLLAGLPSRVNVLLSPENTCSQDLFLRHKTTVRERYDTAWRHAETKGAFDMLFFNEKGELTEGGRSNVFVRLDGRWATPPLQCGLLPGVMRSVLLSDPTWNATERIITIDQLHATEEVIVCNALRGVLTVDVVRS